MLSLNDHRVLDDAVNEVWAAGIPRKFAGDREVYLSTGCEVPDEPVPVISDFGDAKFGDAPFVGEVMPDLYRAPEIVLGIPWDEKIDIWAFGLMVIALDPELPPVLLSHDVLGMGPMRRQASFQSEASKPRGIKPGAPCPNHLTPWAAAARPSRERQRVGQVL